MKNHSQNKKKDRQSSVRRFQKSLVSYVLMLIFFGFLFLRVGVPSFVFFIVAIPMTISIIHKYIDTHQSDDEVTEDDEDEYVDFEEYEEEDWEEEPLDLEEFKSLRKEWEDSDFV